MPFLFYGFTSFTFLVDSATTPGWFIYIPIPHWRGVRTPIHAARYTFAHAFTLPGTCGHCLPSVRVWVGWRFLFGSMDLRSPCSTAHVYSAVSYATGCYHVDCTRPWLVTDIPPHGVPTATLRFFTVTITRCVPTTTPHRLSTTVGSTLPFYPVRCNSTVICYTVTAHRWTIYFGWVPAHAQTGYTDRGFR